MILITIKSIPSIYLNPKNKSISPAGNRTPVSRVTGGDTDHYTTEELSVLGLMDYVMTKHPFSLESKLYLTTNAKLTAFSCNMGTIYHPFLTGNFYHYTLTINFCL